MALRYLDKLIIDGVECQLLTFTDFSWFNDYSGWINNIYSNNYVPPSNINNTGYDFQGLFTRGWISDSTRYSNNIQSNNNKGKVEKYKFTHQGTNYNSISLYFESESYAECGYLQVNADNIQIYYSIALDDETGEGQIIMMQVVPSGNTNAGWYLYIWNNNQTKRKEVYEAFGLVRETSNGGGATHIAKRTGQLKDLSSYTSDILIVSGGGGGGLIVGETAYTGKEAGGISGSGDNSADQSTGNAFGQGESGTNVSGGGSGLYGGYKGTSSKSGGAGSGYIGNSLLSNKKMIGYNVPTSSAEGTKTESVEVFDSNYVANKPKAGNGHARIRLLSEAKILLNNAQSPMYLDEAIDTSAEWYKYNNFDIRSNYLGQDVLSNTNCFMSSENTISSVGFKYLYVTAENTGGSGVNHHAFVCVSEQKITAWLDCYNARHCESFETNDVVETYRVQVDDLAYTDLHITLFGSDSCFKVYKMWFGN